MRLQPKTIMCAVDFSDVSQEIVNYSVALCRTFQAKLFLVHVVSDIKTTIGFAYSEVNLDIERLQKEHVITAGEMIEELVKDANIDYEILIVTGNAATEVSKVALSKKPDLLITASYGKSGIERFMIGSVTERLMKIIHCPLLVLNIHGDTLISQNLYEIKMKKVLIACDFSADSKFAVDYALSLAQEFQTEIHLVHVINPHEHIDLNTVDYYNALPGGCAQWATSDYFEVQQKLTGENREKNRELRENLKKQLMCMVPDESKAWCTPHAVLLDGVPYKKLVNYAKDHDIDLMVLGIRGHTLWDKLMVGSTVDRVVRHTSCPVLVVRNVNESDEE